MNFREGKVFAGACLYTGEGVSISGLRSFPGGRCPWSMSFLEGEVSLVLDPFWEGRYLWSKVRSMGRIGIPRRYLPHLPTQD